MNDCLAWKRDHPVAAYVGSAGQGLGFYHLEVPDMESTQWLNLTNCGIVKLKSGDISLAELEIELSDIYCKEWPWQIRELEKGSFLVRFPPHKKVSDIKNYPSFNLRKEGVRVEVMEWIGDMDPYGQLQEVWIQVTGIPPRWCHWRVFAQIASGFGLMIEMDWPTLFKSFYETVRMKVACKDYKKIPEQRLFEMNKKLHVLSFLVEAVQGQGPGDLGNDGNDGGDEGKKDDDDEDDLYDTDEENDRKQDEPGEEKAASAMKIDVAKTPSGSGGKTVKLFTELQDPFGQVMMLEEKMKQNGDQLLTVGSPLEVNLNLGHIEVCLDPRLEGSDKREMVLTPEIENSELIPDIQSKDYADTQTVEVEGMMDEKWKTPVTVCETILEDDYVDNKILKLFKDPSQHSKWEEFRALAQKESMPTECLTLLQRMELEDSEGDEDEPVGLEGLSMQEMEKAGKMLDQVIGKDRKPKRKQQWGPTLRIPRPRRHSEDGKTMMQKAQELRAAKDYGKGNKNKQTLASESNSSLLNMMECVKISLGKDESMVNHNLEIIKSRDANCKAVFVEANPEINLPRNLDVEVKPSDFPPLKEVGNDVEKPSLQKEKGLSDKSWVKIVNKGLEPMNPDNSSNDRCNMEC